MIWSLLDANDDAALDGASGVPCVGLGVMRPLNADGAVRDRPVPKGTGLKCGHRCSAPLRVGLNGLAECFLRLEVAIRICHCRFSKCVGTISDRGILANARILV